MANTQSKIEKLGHAETVQNLMKNGITVAKKIAEILRTEYRADVSDSSVTRYVAKIKDQINDDAFKTIRSHVDKELPKDLDALEEMEKQCLDWAKEDPKELADRLTEATALIGGELDSWIQLLNSPVEQEKDRKNIVKQIVRRAIGYVLKDARMQAQRIKAMNMATKIIELKLKNAGLLDDETKGRIIIIDSSEDYEKFQSGDKMDGFKPYVVKIADRQN